VIFRENIEDVYAGIEFEAGSEKADKLRDFLLKDLGVKTIRAQSALGIKPMSKVGSQRLVAKAIEYAVATGRPSVTLVHKGNIMKFTEGAFRDWGYALAEREFRDRTISERESWILGNKEATPGISAEENARAIDPGYDLMTPDQKAK